MPKSKLQLTTAFTMLVMAGLLAVDASAADDELRIGRYQSIAISNHCEPPDADEGMQPAANPDAAVTLDSVADRVAMPITDQAASAVDEKHDEK